MKEGQTRTKSSDSGIETGARVTRSLYQRGRRSWIRFKKAPFYGPVILRINKCPFKDEQWHFYRPNTVFERKCHKLACFNINTLIRANACFTNNNTSPFWLADNPLPHCGNEFLEDSSIAFQLFN